jgi:hypothetical protein
MKNLFVPFALAKKLKSKGFDEGCIAEYINDGIFTIHAQDDDEPNDPTEDMKFRLYTNNSSNYFKNAKPIAAPMYQQVIDWLIKNHKLYVSVSPAVEDGDSKFYLTSSVFQLFNEEKNHVGWSNKMVAKEFRNYHEALAEAIEESLELIK